MCECIARQLQGSSHHSSGLHTRNSTLDTTVCIGVCLALFVVLWLVVVEGGGSVNAFFHVLNRDNRHKIRCVSVFAGDQVKTWQVSDASRATSRYRAKSCCCRHAIGAVCAVGWFRECQR